LYEGVNTINKCFKIATRPAFINRAVKLSASRVRKRARVF